MKHEPVIAIDELLESYDCSPSRLIGKQGIRVCCLGVSQDLVQSSPRRSSAVAWKAPGDIPWIEFWTIAIPIL